MLKTNSQKDYLLSYNDKPFTKALCKSIPLKKRNYRLTKRAYNEMQKSKSKDIKHSNNIEYVCELEAFDNIQVIRYFYACNDECIEVERFYIKGSEYYFMSYGCGCACGNYWLRLDTRFEFRNYRHLWLYCDRTIIKSVTPGFEPFIFKNMSAKVDIFTYYTCLYNGKNTPLESIYKINKEFFLSYYLNCYSANIFKHNITKHIRSIQLATKWGYFKNKLNARDYIDHLELVSELGLDLRNAKYIAPVDFNKEHAILSERVEKLREKKRTEREMEEAKKYAEKYKEKLIKYGLFGLVIICNGIKIMPLLSVDEVRLEGKEQHHCVFSNNYYKKDDTLLFTSFDENNNKLETIEYNLTSLSVVQCRGKFNNKSDYHDSIVSIANEKITKHLKENVSI